MPFGCERGTDGRFCFRLWAPALPRLVLELRCGEQWRSVPMEPRSGGWHWHCSDCAQPGDLYRFVLADGMRVPDPASRFQPFDVHGPSEVVDAAAFAWQDDGWRGRPWHEAVFYELHVGSFSPRGDFAGVEARLDALCELGITAIELMPVADFPGRWNWGYDGVLLFAPDSRYGRPEELKSLVQAAHARGLMLFLDVVYNHFGPEGNYLHCYAPGFFDPAHHTPWGAGIAFCAAQGSVVREFFIQNAFFWLEEYGFDGLRLDAVDQIRDTARPDVLDTLAARVRAGPGARREIHLVLENDHNDARRYQTDSARRPRAFTAQWNDDAHHALHVALTGESAGVYGDYADAPFDRLGRALAEGFCYQGEPSAFRGGQARGAPSRALPPSAFVNFLQNHDQVGNRAFGERLEQLISAPLFETALAVFLLAPAPPLLFMGQEFAATSPFLFFCDLEPDLLAQVEAGRRQAYAAGGDAQASRDILSPGDPRAFSASCLDWQQRDSPTGRARLALHGDLLRRRARHIVALLPQLTQGGDWRRYGRAGLAWRWPARTGETLYLSANLGDAPLLVGEDQPRDWPRDWAFEPERARIAPIYERPVKTAAPWPPGWVCCWIARHRPSDVKPA